MATILIHAGTPKAGSTAIQQFLARNRDRLALRGVTLAVATRPEHGIRPIRVGAYTEGNIVSSQLVQPLLGEAETKRRVMKSLIRGLDRLARDASMIILTQEGLAQPIWRADPQFLGPLDRLAGKHAVRIAYYVRPQHTALEARWRQWGFRMGMSPAAFIESRAEQLRYLDTLESVRATAPGIDFVLRPFRRDLLDGGDVVVDFARHFLASCTESELTFSGSPANVGLSLELINLLSHAPQGFFGPTVHDNRKFDRVKALLGDLQAKPSTDTERGRRMLQSWCHQCFESSNKELLHQLGWPTESFVPPAGDVVYDLRPLDALWRSNASPMEVEAFFRLLDSQLQRETGRARQTIPSGHAG